MQVAEVRWRACPRPASVFDQSVFDQSVFDHFGQGARGCQRPRKGAYNWVQAEAELRLGPATGRERDRESDRWIERERGDRAGDAGDRRPAPGPRRPVPGLRVKTEWRTSQDGLTGGYAASQPLVALSSRGLAASRRARRPTRGWDGAASARAAAGCVLRAARTSAARMNGGASQGGRAEGRARGPRFAIPRRSQA